MTTVNTMLITGPMSPKAYRLSCSQSPNKHCLQHLHLLDVDDVNFESTLIV